MKRITVVGAGLAGLTAAVNLARAGYEVTVLEKEKRIGGNPIFRPDPAGSPIDLPRLAQYIGIDISPATKRIEESHQVVWGKQYAIRPRAGVPLYMVERGPRPSSLDSLLYETALAAGVKVKFGRSLNTREDFDKLPPGSIIATGFDRAAHQVLGIPHEVGKSYVAKGTADHNRTSVTVYIGEYSVDYGFSCSINGICYAFIFHKGQSLSERGLKAFEADIRRVEKYELGPWQEASLGAVNHETDSSPRLFAGDKILTGTLAGTIEPLMGFGMLGALLSGKIAAVAVSDRARALKEFQRLNRFYKSALYLKKRWNNSPNWLRLGLAGIGALAYNLLPDAAVNYSYRMVPGYGRMG